MLRRDNPYLYLAATLVLVVLSSGLTDPVAQVVAAASGLAAAAVAVVLFLRQARDPNGPPGQH